MIHSKYRHLIFVNFFWIHFTFFFSFLYWSFWLIKLISNSFCQCHLRQKSHLFSFIKIWGIPNYCCCLSLLCLLVQQLLLLFHLFPLPCRIRLTARNHCYTKICCPFLAFNWKWSFEYLSQLSVDITFSIHFNSEHLSQKPIKMVL